MNRGASESTTHRSAAAVIPLAWSPRWRDRPVHERGPDDRRRVALYSHDAYGLGNLRRMLAVAEYLTAQDPSMHVLLITGAPMVHGFRISSQIDFIKLPALSRDRQGHYRVRSLPMSSERLLAMRAELIRCALEAYRPHLLLVDKKPMGVGGELRRWIAASEGDPERRPAMVLLLRDILDTAEKTRAIWRRRGDYAALERHYDLILVAGQPDVFDVARAYAFPPALRRRLRYCGYIDRLGAMGRPRVAPRPGRVLVTVGGGDDGFEVVRCFLEGMRAGRAPAVREALVVTGPEMADAERERLQRLAAGLPQVRLQAFCADLPHEAARAAAVVSMGGYNTVVEMLSLGRPLVVVPRIAPVREQWLRAQALARRGLLRMVDPEALTPERLMAAVEAALTTPALTGRGLDLGGLPRIAYWVRRLLATQEAGRATPLPQGAWHGGDGDVRVG